MIRRIVCTKFIIINLLLFLTVNPVSADENNFKTFLDELDNAVYEFLNGDAEAFKSIWLHSEDITIAGGFGGRIEKGWDKIGERLDRVNAVYEKAEFSTERISYATSGEIGYLVQHEHIKFFSSGNTVESERNYRVTMIFKLEEGEWKLVHRHADPSMNWQPPD